MGGTAAGYLCPECGGELHNIQKWNMDAGRPLGITLSCHSCEHVWYVDLTE